MKKHISRTVCSSVAAVLLALPGCAQQAAPAARDTSPQILDVQGGKIRVVTVASGLFHPGGIAFADANSILVTEKNGKLRIIRDGVLAPQPIWTSPTPTGQANDALHFVAVHPKFADNQLVYVTYPKQGEKGTTLAVARGHLKGSSLGDVEEIFVALDEQTVTVPGTEAAALIVPSLAGSLAAVLDQRKLLAGRIEELLEAHPLMQCVRASAPTC